MALPDRLSDWLAADDWLAPPAPARPPRRSDRPHPRTRAGHPGRADPSRARRPEARRRTRLIRRRRLDLLQDAALALLLASIVLIETAGLGVVALLSAFTALALIASLVVERRLAQKRR